MERFIEYVCRIQMQCWYYTIPTSLLIEGIAVVGINDTKLISANPYSITKCIQIQKILWIFAKWKSLTFEKNSHFDRINHLICLNLNFNLFYMWLYTIINQKYEIEFRNEQKIVKLKFLVKISRLCWETG